MGIGRCGGGRYGGGHYGGGRYGRGRYGGASQKGVDATAEPPESSFSHYYGRYCGDTAESLQYNDASVICMAVTVQANLSYHSNYLLVINKTTESLKNSTSRINSY